MSNLVLILGESGTGKSTSIETLDEKETFIIQVINKPLPFKGFKANYPLLKNKEGQRFISDRSDKIIDCLMWINQQEYIKNVVIDDFQYVLANEYMRRAKEKSFDKYSDMANNYHSIIQVAQQLREDLNIIFMSHIERTEDGRTKVKTIGKALDKYITVEGLFTIVLSTEIEDDNYYFETQNNGFNTTKSPKGMFEELKIPNDLNYVITKINEYYGG